MTKRTAHYVFSLGGNITDKISSVYPIWPEFIEEQYRYFPRGKNLILYNPERSLVILQGGKVPQKLKGDLFVELTIGEADRKRVMLTGKDDCIIDYAFLWQDEEKISQYIQRNTTKVKIYDSLNNENKFEDESSKVLPKGQLVIEADRKVEVVVYAEGIPISKKSGNTVIINEVKNNCEIRVYDGMVLVKSLKFEVDALIEINENEIDQYLYQRLVSLREKDLVTFRHDTMSVFGALKGFPKCRRWLQKCRVRGKIPRNAVKIIYYEIKQKGIKG